MHMSNGRSSDHPPAGLTLDGKPHVLIVDDNQANRVVAAAFCDLFDCTHDFAHDGLDAVEAVRTQRYDLILMDIQMPRMDGVEATQAIRALGLMWSDVPIIAVTANAEPEDVAAYMACGMSGAVVKPLQPAKLLAAMSEGLHAINDDLTGWRPAVA
jgi:two-component system, sensor histidine kinase